jgi:hypothetical protein
VVDAGVEVGGAVAGGSVTVTIVVGGSVVAGTVDVGGSVDDAGVVVVTAVGHAGGVGAAGSFGMVTVPAQPNLENTLWRVIDDPSANFVVEVTSRTNPAPSMPTRSSVVVYPAASSVVNASASARRCSSVSAGESAKRRTSTVTS